MKKGMSLVELIVSFTMISLLSVVVFRTILNIQATQIRNIAYNNFITFHLTLNRKLQEDLVTKKITQISGCGNNCYNIRYAWQEGGINRQEIRTLRQITNTEGETLLIYHDYIEKLPRTFYLEESFSLQYPELNNQGANTFDKMLIINIPLKSTVLERNTNMRYIYQYNNSINPIIIN